MDKLIFCTLIIFVGFTSISTQTDDYGSTKEFMLMYLKLDHNATARDICNGFMKIVQSELEIRKKNGQSGVLPPSDRNHIWIDECKKPEVTMEDVLPLIHKAMNTYSKSGGKQ